MVLTISGQSLSSLFLGRRLSFTGLLLGCALGYRDGQICFSSALSYQVLFVVLGFHFLPADFHLCKHVPWCMTDVALTMATVVVQTY